MAGFAPCDQVMQRVDFQGGVWKLVCKVSPWTGYNLILKVRLADGVVHRLVVKKPLRVTQSADATATKEGRAAWVTTDMTKLWEL